MVCGIESGFKVHEIEGIFIPQKFQRGVEFIIGVPELEEDGHKIEEVDKVGDVTEFLHSAVEAFTGTPQGVAVVGKEAGGIGIGPGTGGGDISDTRQIGNGSEITAEAAEGFRAAEDIKNGHTLIETGMNKPVL